MGTRGYRWQEFGSRVKAARKRCRMTQEELGEQLAVDARSIANWESGYARPRLDRLAKLAAALSTSTEWLLSKEEKRVAEGQAPYLVEDTPPTDEELRLALELIRSVRKGLEKKQ